MNGDGTATTDPAAAEPSPYGPDLLWEVPLALLSWGFFRINRALIAFLYQRYLDRDARRGLTWRLLSEATLRIPVSLPVLMTKGPRWNTHAAIGTLGPLAVSGSLEIRTGDATRGAESWTVVVYRYPDFATFCELHSLEPSHQEEWTRLDLPAGRYSLGVRYYGLRPRPAMPAVRIDGREAVAAEPVPAGVNDVYAHLAGRTNPYYRALHHYVHTLLRLRSLLPAALVRREYLPVGDPCTSFRYDWFPAGTELEVEASPSLARTHRIYLTVYNRASLPVHSAEIEAPPQGPARRRTSVFPHAGFYLIRLRPRLAEAPAGSPEDLIVRRRAPG
ncbi:MAG: DUF6208 family protein [Synechococcaceae cyanobacterium]|nr:DUF6208 family protein [Synechococcaceae cyanobacterium]